MKATSAGLKVEQKWIHYNINGQDAHHYAVKCRCDMMLYIKKSTDCRSHHYLKQ